MNSSPSAPEHLDTLAASVNKTLVETGRFFRDSGSAKSRAQIKRNLPVAHDQFQNALDELSVQILIAKAVLEKEYRDVRAKRAAETTDVVMEEPVAVPEDQSISNTTENVKQEQTSPQQVREDHSTKPEQVGDSLKFASNVKSEAPVTPTSNEQALPVDSHDATGDVGEEINFDSMFADTGNDGEGLDLGMNFSTDVSGSQNLLVGTNIFDEVIDQSGKDQGSIGSLLPGLESYANAAGDDLNLSLTQTDHANSGNQDQLDDGTDQPFDHHQQNLQDDVQMGQSNFDDLFLDTGAFGDGGDGDGLLNADDLADLGTLDDGWLNSM